MTSLIIILATLFALPSIEFSLRHLNRTDQDNFYSDVNSWRYPCIHLGRYSDDQLNSHYWFKLTEIYTPLFIRTMIVDKNIWAEICPKSKNILLTFYFEAQTYKRQHLVSMLLFHFPSLFYWQKSNECILVIILFTLPKFYCKNGHIFAFSYTIIIRTIKVHK